MTHPPRATLGSKDDVAVSNVLGAILMFGLLVLTLTVIQVKFVPVWTEDREARHMQTLADDLRQLKSDLDRQAGNDTATTITDSLPLRNEGGFRFFQSGGNLGSTATFVPSPTGTGISVSSAWPVQILRRNGQDLFSAGNQWDPILDGDTDVTNVLAIEHLRERIDLCEGVISAGSCPDSYIGGPASNDYDAADQVTLEVFGSADDINPLATIITTTQVNSGEYTFTMHLYDSALNEVSTISESLFQQVVLDYMYFDILDSSLFLEPLLASGQPPYRFHLVEQGIQADYQVVYTDAETGAVSGSAGILDPAGYATTEGSGRVVITANNQHYPNQVYTLEHGAVLVAQDAGAAMAAPPDFAASISTTQASVSWTLAGLSGEGLTLGADRVAAVAAPTGNVVDVWVATPSVTLTIPTAYATAWESYLDDLLTAAGWVAGQYTLTPSSANLVVVLEGPVAADLACTALDQTACVYDVSLRFRLSNIDLSLVPAG